MTHRAIHIQNEVCNDTCVWAQCNFFAGCIGLYLEEFLELGSEIADFLLCQEKEALLSIARRKV